MINLDLSLAAKDTAISIRKLESYVEVLALYGRMGDGKSSYARMLAEELCEDNTSLYTYISLTETNEAKDFSVLFAERWFDTLRERYPKMNNSTNSLVLMKSILRETGHGWVSAVMEYVATFGDGILKTKVKDGVCDASAGYEPHYTSSTVAQVFGNIYEIREERWIIVIDEVERAKFEEIYRVIEVIERFKVEGRSGLPVQLIFLLCIDPEELSALLNKYESSYPITHLIKSFFITNPKSISLPIYLPLLDFNTKESYILDQLQEIIKTYSISKASLVHPDTKQESLEIYWARGLVEPLKQFQVDEKKALDFVLTLLMEESLRTINRVTQKIDQFYRSFLTTDGKPNVEAIRFSDIVTVSYASVKYPFIIDFLKQTIDTVFYEDIDNQTVALQRHLLEGFLSDEKKPKEKIPDWVVRLTGAKITESERTIVEDLIAAISYRYVEYARGDKARESRPREIERSHSLSIYDNLRDYLSVTPGTPHSAFGKNYPIYQQHLASSIPRNIHGETLLEYSSFLRRFEVSNSNLHFDAAQRIFEEMNNGQLKPEGKSLRDSLYQKATYEFEFQLLNSLMAYDNPLTPKATALFISFMRSPNINSEAKVSILGGQVNVDRSNSEIHSRLNEGFEKMLAHDKIGIVAAVKTVLKEFEERYLVNKESVYEKEGNFFYTLYQMWNGEVDDRSTKFSYPQLRRIALNGLTEDGQALELLWSRWPYEKGWKGYDDFVNNHSYMREKNMELYMPLETLIEVTKKTELDVKELEPRVKFWEQIVKSSKFKEDNILQNDGQTVRSILLNKYEILD